MRFLFVYDAIYPETVGGVEHRNRALAESLAARGHQVTIAGFADSAVISPSGVEILPLARPRPLHTRRGKRSLLQALRLAWHCRRLPVADFDLVETANIPFLHIFPLARRCRSARVPLIITWHEHWGEYWRRYGWLGSWRAYTAVERWATGRGTRAIAVSQLTASRVEEARGTPVSIVPNGVPRKLITSLVQSEQSSPAAPRDRVPIVFAGRLIEDKRLHLLLDAVAILAAKRSGPLLRIIGGGADRTALAARARDLGIEQAVRFEGTLPTSDELWRYLARSDVAIQPSAREGFGMFALEAMAAGLPVVYCRSPESATGELVRNGIEGLAVAPDPRALAKALDHLLDDQESRRAMAARAVKRAGAYDWALVTDSFLALAVELTGGSAEQKRSDG